jgi:hypothetical protein
MRLLALKSGPQILKFLDDLEKETKAIIEDIATLAIYSGQNYDDMWKLTMDERKIFTKILKDKVSLDRGVKPKDVITQELI